MSAESLRDEMRRATLMDEGALLARLVPAATLAPDRKAAVLREATRLVEGVRLRRAKLGDLDTFLAEYGLSTHEGVALMCLAEALLRIPDADTADRLIKDKLGAADWERHLGHSGSAFVNASTWALMLTGRLVRFETGEAGLGGLARRLAARTTEPVVREALVQAMRILGRQFVMGRTIEDALERAQALEAEGWRHSFDMLGEAARTAEDAERYWRAYAGAVAAIGAESGGGGPVEGPGLSVKLSALHPRFEAAQRDRVLDELTPRLAELCRLAAAAGIGLTVDAEEAERLDLSLDVLDRVMAEPGLAGWDGLGLAVQAYQKRAWFLIDWLAERARAHRRRLAVRLVKGAYWDTEIKRAQERGLADYPVFTRKAATDVSYLACARKLLDAPDAFRPAFATHNAHTLATISEMAGKRADWEFQRLHGMGEALYRQVVPGRPCRVYAPVGSHEDLLPYLVRRLLENGANTSFVNRIADASVPAAEIVADPAESLAAGRARADARLRPPPLLFAPERRNSAGVDLADRLVQADLAAALGQAASGTYRAAPLVGGAETGGGPVRPVRDPADRRRIVGEAAWATEEAVAEAAARAATARPAWDALGGEGRAAVLERASDLFEGDCWALMYLAVREAGKTIPDALGEVREAVDFLRYYAARARADFSRPVELPGVVGESNRLSLHGRGVFACVSPWNFPLAIFTGQVAAALAAGNAVLAKPAEQTPLIAARALRLLHEAGVPADALHLLPGDGAVGEALVRRPEVAGVAFTGSTETARAINRALADKDGPIATLIAETGGLNAMVVDSSALPEQVVADVIASAFSSAGQRCSALRLLLVQDEIHARVTSMLAGAAALLSVGDPMRLSTDVGPVIDEAALGMLEEHARRLERDGRLLFRCPLREEAVRHGLFFAPMAAALDDASALTREVFGPILHVVRYSAQRLDQALAAVAAGGYGLTLGVHSRIESFAERVRAAVPAGNVYVNRSMVGAVVGAQPFGGEGLSGTGPKAGGPHTLARFATERVVTVNTAAAGGNAELLVDLPP